MINNEAFIFWTDFRENTQISNLIKIRSLGAELFRADRQTDEQTRRSDIIWVQSITQQVFLTMFIEDENITTCFGLIRPSSGLHPKGIGDCNNYAVM